jgi:hypothetical protein
MKEIWMEKLIELLNEYAKVLWIWDYVWWHNKKTIENSDYIFTKKFWFIKWLVDNEKIDIHNIPPISITRGEEERAYNEPVMLDDSLLMLLSVSDTPIEDLVSYLK